MYNQIPAAPIDKLVEKYQHFYENDSSARLQIELYKFVVLVKADGQPRFVRGYMMHLNAEKYINYQRRCFAINPGKCLLEYELYRTEVKS